MLILHDCWKCSRRQPSKQVVWPTFTTDRPKLLIIGEAPGPDENEQGLGFVGKAGELLRGCLRDAKFDPELEVAYTNTVFCYGNGVKDKPVPDQINACARNLWRAVMHANAEVIICAGKYASQTILGLGKITEVHGTFRYTNPGKNVWNAIRLEDFCVEQGMEFPMGEDGVLPEKFSDQVFLDNFLPPYQQRGFEIVDPPRLQCMPVLHPSSFLYEKNRDEAYKLTNALAKVKNWIEGFDGRANKDYEAIQDPKAAIVYMDQLIAMYESGEIPYFAMDLETVGAEGNEHKGGLLPFALGGRVVTINLSHKPHFGRVIIMFHPEGRMSLDQQELVAVKYRELLAKVPVVGANLKFDLHWSRFKLGARKWTIAFDTQLASYALHLGTSTPHGLKEVTNRNLPNEAGYADDLTEFYSSLPKEDRHMLNVPLNKLVFYAAEDVDVVLQLIPILSRKLVATQQWEPFHLFGIHPYAAFIEMEQNGARIDPEMRDKLAKEAEAEMQAIKDRFKTFESRKEWVRRRSIIAMASRAEKKMEKARNKPIKPDELDLNFNSPRQIAELLFDIAGLPIRGELGKDKTPMFPHGVPSTKEEVLTTTLEELTIKGEHESERVKILEMIKDYRTSSKIYSTYLKKAYLHCPVTEVPDWWEERSILNDPRKFEAEIYMLLCQAAVYNLTRTATGRTSSSGPNIQQVAKHIRRMYLSRFGTGGLIANFDVGQAELRVIAATSRDHNFIAILSDPNRDIHREVAALGFNKPVDQVTEDERFQAKSVVFGTAYGRSPASIAIQLKISVEKAQEIQNALFSMMPEVADWIEEKHAESDRSYYDDYAGFTRQGTWTPTKRWRDLSMWYNRGERHRRAVNTPIQGGASDIIVWATGQIHVAMQKAEAQSKMWAFVHDSVVFDAIPEEAVFLMATTKKYLVDQIPLRFPWMVVPMVVDFQFGPTWGDQCDVTYDFETGDMGLSGSHETLLETLNRFGDCLSEVRLEDNWGVLAADGKKIKASGKWQKNLRMTG